MLLLFGLTGIELKVWNSLSRSKSTSDNDGSHAFHMQDFNWSPTSSCTSTFCSHCVPFYTDFVTEATTQGTWGLVFLTHIELCTFSSRVSRNYVNHLLGYIFSPFKFLDWRLFLMFGRLNSILRFAFATWKTGSRCGCKCVNMSLWLTQSNLHISRSQREIITTVKRLSLSEMGTLGLWEDVGYTCWCQKWAFVRVGHSWMLVLGLQCCNSLNCFEFLLDIGQGYQIKRYILFERFEYSKHSLSWPVAPGPLNAVGSEISQGFSTPLSQTPVMNFTVTFS